MGMSTYKLPYPEYTGEYRSQFANHEWDFVFWIFSCAYNGLPWVYILAPQEDKIQAGNRRIMLDRLVKDINERLARPWENKKDVLKKILFSLDKSRDLCEFIKDTQRRKEVVEYEPMVSKGDSPSEKQIAYLRSLGCRLKPTSKFHASQLINEYKNKKVAV
jgi:hypothetical protein